MNFPQFRLPDWPWPLSHFALGALVVIGLAARVWGLGDGPLTTDEYFLGRSVFQILEHGVPRFDCGGFYTRGILQQYLTAPIVAWSLDPEWALRIVPVLANLLGIPAVYLLGRRLGGIPLACAAASLYSLSLWEIEFARFARMYAPFQTVFLWQIVLLLKVLIDGNRSALKWMYGVAAAGMLIYEGAIFLMVLPLLPFLAGKVRPTFRHAAVFVALLVSAVAYQMIDFRHFGVTALSEEIGSLVSREEAGITLPVSLPPLLAVGLLADIPLAGFIPVMLSIWSLRRLWRDEQTFGAERVVWTAILLSAVFNLFAVALAIWLIACCLGRIRSAVHPGSGAGAAFAAVLLLAVFWIVFALISPSGGASGEPPGFARLGGIFPILLGYPDLYGRIIRLWGGAMPATTGMLLFLLTIGLAVFLWGVRARPSGPRTFGYLFAVLLSSLLLAAVLETNYQASRYTFFLYPLVLLLSVAVLSRAAQAWSRPGMEAGVLYSLVFLFAFSAEDFGFHHLRRIATPEIAFRTAYGEARQDLYTYRRDFSSPARFINEHLEPEDIIVSAVRVTDFYLDRIDFMYINFRSRSFLNYAACGGTREIWSNAPLVYRSEDLSRIMRDSGHRVWMIVYADHWGGDERDLLALYYGECLVYTNIDQTINVYRIPPAGVGR